MIESATILVADDSSDDIEILKRAFQEAGLNNPITSVSSGDEAIEFLQRGEQGSGSDQACPLLMLLDLNMPGSTGFSVLDWLRRQPNLRSLPTIVWSNSDQPADIENCFRLGAHGYWIKPSRFEDLVKMITRLKELLVQIVRKLDPELPASVPA